MLSFNRLQTNCRRTVLRLSFGTPQTKLYHSSAGARLANLPEPVPSKKTSESQHGGGGGSRANFNHTRFRKNVLVGSFMALSAALYLYVGQITTGDNGFNLREADKSIKKKTAEIANKSFEMDEKIINKGIERVNEFAKWAMERKEEIAKRKKAAEIADKSTEDKSVEKKPAEIADKSTERAIEREEKIAKRAKREEEVLKKFEKEIADKSTEDKSTEKKAAEIADKSTEKKAAEIADKSTEKKAADKKL